MSDPYHVDIASKEARLFLTRTKGSLSGGTRVRLVSTNSDYSTMVVAARVRVKVPTAPYYKIADQEVMVTLDDLVIRRMPHHPDTLNPAQGKSRAERRKQQLAQRRVLEQLKGNASE
jgi:hypothetical protein